MMITQKTKSRGAATQSALTKDFLHRNNTNSKPRKQACYGYGGYEFLKRAFLDANPNSTSNEFEQACSRFARLAGV